jgi:hypothetical protein
MRGMDDRDTARALAWGRIALGVSVTLVPRLVLRPALRDATGPPLWFTRAFGVRDVIIGAGTLAALDRGSGEDLWLTASAASDTADAALAVLFGRELGGKLAVGSLLTSVPAAVTGWKLAAALRPT